MHVKCGAEGETRTPMSIQTLDPEPSASTSSATSARTGANECNRRSRVALNIFFYYACQGHTLIDRKIYWMQAAYENYRPSRKYYTTV